MDKGKYLATDAETGGIGHDKSLLTAYFLVLDENFNKIDDLHLRVKPNAGAPYVVSAEALEINKIDLVQHDRIAITESEAGGLLRQFLVRNTIGHRPIKLIPLGQNVMFDMEFYYAHLLNKKECQKYISYRCADTATVGQFLKDQGKIPETVTGSLESFMTHFSIKYTDRPHEEFSDTWAAVDVYREMLKL